MNTLILAIVLSLAAGFGGAWLYGQWAGATSAHDAAGTSDADLLADQIAALKREIQDLRTPPATLRASAPAGAPGSTAATEAALVEAVLVKLDERVDGRVSAKFEALAAQAKDEGRDRRRSKRRVSLSQAAKDLSLSGREEDELARIYEASLGRFMKLAAGPEGDVEAVKRDLEAAAKDPAAANGLMAKYGTNMINNLGEMMAIQVERNAAIVKAIGPAKAKRLDEEFDIKEANPMGGEIRMEARMGADLPGGR